MPADMPAEPSPPLSPAASSAPPEPTLAASQAQTLREWANRYHHWLLGGAVLVYVLGFNGEWRLTPDSADHALLARQLAEGHGFADLEGQAAQQVHPGLPWLLALNFRLFGQGVFWPAVLAVMVMGLAGLSATYLWLRLAFDRATAVIVTCLTAINFSYYHYSFHLLTDTPFVCGLMSFLAGWEATERGRGARRALGLAAVVLGVLLMAAFRSVVMLVLLAVGLALLWRLIRGPQRRWPVLILAAAAVGVLALRLADPRIGSVLALSHDEQLFLELVTDRLTTTWHQVLDVHLPELFRQSLPNAAFGVELKVLAGNPLSILLVILTLGLARYRPLWAIVPATFLLQILVLRPATRYLLPLVPLLALAWWLGACWMNQHLRGPWARRVFVIMLVLWVAPNLVQIGDFIVEQRRVPFQAHYKDGHYMALAQFGQQVAEVTEPDALILKDGRYKALIWFASRRIEPAHQYAGADLDKGKAFWRDLPADQPVYVVTPPGEYTWQLIKEIPLRLGPAVVSVLDENGKEINLHQVWAVPEPPPTQATR